MDLHGLTSSQVIKSREKYGSNKMPEPTKKTAWQFFKEVFDDKINVILLVMMLLFAVLSAFGYGSMYEAIGIGTVLLVVTCVTVITKLKSQKSTLELRRRASQLFVNVLRDGIVTRLDSSDVVVGDIVLVQAGETICADGFLISGAISVNNSILNGESEECEKTPIKDFVYNRNKTISSDDYVNQNYVFAGTTILSGDGVMQVARVGLDTENAKILTALHSIDEVKTTLQLQLDDLADKISKIGSISACLICVIMFAVHVYTNGIGTPGDMLYAALNIVTVALTIFVAAVPEGLPFIIGIITGQNVKYMIKHNILAKNPNKIPEAGNIQLLCTDKTGTLTHGNLCPISNYLGNGFDMGFDVVVGGVAKEAFIKNILLNGRAMYDDNNQIVGGNVTERALLSVLGLSRDEISAYHHDVKIGHKIIFNSTNKYSGTCTKYKKLSRTYFMGAPEVLLSHTKNYIDENGALNKINRKKIDAIISENTARAMRVVALAYSETCIDSDTIPDDLVLISLVTMRDEIRPGVSDVIASMRKSNIQVMMITGDTVSTARAIASDCGIITDASDIAITATEFDEMSDAVALRKLSKIKVIARATPATKLRVVKLAQSRGLCIGMCGDGTNDAPALKRADVGFAMGDSTDVCKESSDIIITDNNFISVANSILLGRTFMRNVVNFLRFQLPINFSLVIISMLFPILLGFDALTAVQILLVNIVMDSLNSLAFGGEPPRSEYMQTPAMGKNAPLLTRATMINVAWSTIIFTAIFGLTLLPFVRDIFGSPDTYLSGRFALLIVMAIMNGFFVRTDGYNIFYGLRRNPMFIVVAFGVIIGCVACVQFGGNILQLVPLTLSQWAIVFGLSLLIIPLNYIRIFLSHIGK